MNYVNPLYSNENISQAMKRYEEIISNYKQSISVLLETPTYQEMKNIQAQIDNLMIPFAQAIQNCMPNGNMISASLSNSLENLMNVCKELSTIHSDSNTEDKSDKISEEIQTIVSELPIDDTAKEEIVSSEEYQSLKKKEPWTKELKIKLVATIVIPLIIPLIAGLTEYIINKSNPKEPTNEITYNNLTINVDTNSEDDFEIRQALESKKYLEGILFSLLEIVDEKDDNTTNSSQNSLDSSSLKELPEASPSQYPKAVDSQQE